jgi:hypothetical protein
MRYTFYECPTHGRLEVTAYFRAGVLDYRCKACDAQVVLKEIVVCKHHGELPDELITTRKTCRICHRQTASQKRNNNREAFNAKQALDREENPEKWDAIYKRAYSKLRHNKGADLSLHKVCNARRITIDRYQELVKEQENKCGICGLEETCKDPKHDRVRRLSIDHCHRTGNVRGLLCHSCNTAIGKFKDDIELLHKAIRYITQHH